MRRSRPALLAAAVLAAATVTAIAAPAVSAKKPDKAPVAIQILGLNDFHGQLEVVGATASSGGRIGRLTTSTTDNPPAAANTCVPTDPGRPCFPAGGAEYLATHVRNLRATNPNTVFVSAGDLIGATPLLSAAFHDEPSIEAFNLMGLDYNGVGNHEFDEGIDELLRMRYGPDDARGYTPARPDGCHPVDGCGDGDPYGGAEFDFLAANVTYKNNGRTIFPPYAVHNFPGGVKVAFIGMTLEGTPLIVSPDGIASVDFNDEADSVNALIPALKRRGVEAFVVLLHEGGSPSNTGVAPSAINTCISPSGDIVDVVNRMSDDVDIVITGHTNWAVNCNIGGKIVTGAASQGRLITDIDATIDRTTGEFVNITVENKIVTQNVPLAADITALMAKYNAVIAPIRDVVVGSVTAAMDRAVVAPGGDSSLGRLIADAQLESTESDGAVIAFMNPGGIRGNLDLGPITYGEAFAVQPFSNIVTSKLLTGAQIDLLLEQQFTTNNTTLSAGGGLRTQFQILQVSDGFTYTWNGLAPAGNRVDPASIMLDGVQIVAGQTYRVAMNNFIASGGDDFQVLRAGTAELTGDDDLVVLVDYLGGHDAYTPIATSRISRVDVAPTP